MTKSAAAEKLLKSFGNMDNLKLSETLRKLNQSSNDENVSKLFPNFSTDDSAFGKMKVSQNSWCLIGGNGVQKEEPDDGSCIFVNSFQPNKPKRERYAAYKYHQILDKNSNLGSKKKLKQFF